ncbi:MAG TPA: hypothetical protein VGB55_05650 [Tepidisphaeraceae bacterium]|jgi:hypothetical protein
MLRTFEATIDEDGTVRLSEAVSLPKKSRALLTILDSEPLEGSAMECALMAESALARDWLDPEQETYYEALAKLPAIDDDGREIK